MAIFGRPMRGGWVVGEASDGHTIRGVPPRRFGAILISSCGVATVLQKLSSIAIVITIGSDHMFIQFTAEGYVDGNFWSSHARWMGCGRGQ